MVDMDNCLWKMVIWFLVPYFTRIIGSDKFLFFLTMYEIAHIWVQMSVKKLISHYLSTTLLGKNSGKEHGA